MTHDQAKVTLSHVRPEHTPGPWKLKTGLREDNTPYTIVVRCIGSEPRICEVDEIDAECEAENAANAQLITAAPETAAERDRLKEINQRLLDTLKFVLEDHNSVIDYECGEIIRATIAKANTQPN